MRKSRSDAELKAVLAELLGSRRRVWVCETQNGRGRWVVWFAHRDRPAVFQSMRDGRARYPKAKFRTVPYSANDGDCDAT